MRIGVATWFGSKNFGTNLQCYALCRYLQSCGHKVYLIQPFRHDRIGFIYKIRRTLGKVKRHFSHQKLSKKDLEIIKEYENKYLTIYPLVTTKNGYKKLLDNFDCFFSGSDQIWNPFYLSSFFFLDFAGTKPRFAYASSLGVSEIPLEKSSVYKEELKHFKHIGVREKTGVDIVNQLLGENKAVQVLDPTFLLSKDEWAAFSKKTNLKNIQPHSYMFLYLIGNREEYPNYVKKIQQHYNISDIICVKSAEGGVYTDATLILDRISPMQFVYFLMNARLVCTDSFHATALSINMNLNFVELLRFENADKQSQNSRIYDLLNHYILSDRIYAGMELPNETIVYDRTNSILCKDREKSVNFINDCLHIVKI